MRFGSSLAAAALVGLLVAGLTYGLVLLAPAHPVLAGTALYCLVFLLPTWCTSLVAERRGLAGGRWVGLGLLTGPAALLAVWLVRPGRRWAGYRGGHISGDLPLARRPPAGPGRAAGNRAGRA